jgi:hypothetical protein
MPLTIPLGLSATSAVAKGLKYELNRPEGAEWFFIAALPALWNAKPIPLGSAAMKKD